MHPLCVTVSVHLLLLFEPSENCRHHTEMYWILHLCSITVYSFLFLDISRYDKINFLAPDARRIPCRFSCAEVVINGRFSSKLK